MSKPRRTVSHPTIPKIEPARRMLWWTQLITAALLLVLPILVWWLAGGTVASLERPPVEQLVDPGRPLIAAVAVFVAMMVFGSTTEYEARYTERRHFQSWYMLMHPDQAPDVARVAELSEKILRKKGPLHPYELRRHLAQGGEWGAPLSVSGSALHRILRNDGDEWFAWLTPRQTGHPLSHVDNPYQPTGDELPALTAGSVATSRQVLENLVRLTGPTTWEQMHANLTRGGPWGPPVPVSKLAMSKLLREPGHGETPRVAWLAPRERGDLFDHVDNVELRTEATS